MEKLVKCVVLCLLLTVWLWGTDGWAQVSPATAKPLEYQTTQPVEVLEQGHVLVKVRLNETEDATFMIDTGAASCIISEELVRKLKLSTHPAIGMDGLSVRLKGRQVKAVTVPYRLAKKRNLAALPHSFIPGCLTLAQNARCS